MFAHHSRLVIDNIVVINKYHKDMKEEIRVLQDWSLQHFGMIPVTITQLLMIKKEYVSYHALNKVY